MLCHGRVVGKNETLTLLYIRFTFVPRLNTVQMYCFTSREEFEYNAGSILMVLIRSALIGEDAQRARACNKEKTMNMSYPYFFS